MDLLLQILGVVLLLTGLIGCVLPLIPGPPLVYASLLLLQLTSTPPFDADFLLLWAVVTLIVTILDYVVPVYGTKKLGGTRMGVCGATVGLIAGIFFFPPLGLIVGPFAGAFIGEIMAGQRSERALKSALGSFAGFLAGTMMKLIVSVWMGYYFFAGLW